jgi:hypothetical protein
MDITESVICSTSDGRQREMHAITVHLASEAMGDTLKVGMSRILTHIMGAHLPFTSQKKGYQHNLLQRVHLLLVAACPWAHVHARVTPWCYCSSYSTSTKLLQCPFSVSIVFA